MRGRADPRRNRRWRTAVFAAPVTAALALGACTSDGRSVATTSGSSAASAATSPPVTDAPTTTQEPTAATPLVRQAVLDYWAASRACGQRPRQCKPESFTAAQGDLRTELRAYVATLLSANQHLATPDTVTAGGTAVPTDGSYVLVDAVTVDLATEATATTDECVYDPVPLLGPPGPDGQPTVVSAQATPHRFVHTFYLEDGRWLPGVEQVDTSGACDNTADTVPFVDTVPIGNTVPDTPDT